ncbi:UNVERIFIED_CONTAM: Retrovirus-related Pol polyprotein from transposon TNT 1-94 [Sesamum latifolium]|uniref:Retrovirus-related Pol polyprotein from transposon TNT 1-94 n=1 Tax=Sesamum latifolium TaxID=2727402 RepID=A0AAW2T8Q5_9LAMI
MGNQISSKIMGMGNVILATIMGCEFMLKDVRHIPNMRLNLISVGKLDDAGYVNSFGAGKWKLTRSSIIVIRGRKEGSFYVTSQAVQGKD